MMPIVGENPGIFAYEGSEPRQAIAYHGSSYAIAVVDFEVQREPRPAEGRRAEDADLGVLVGEHDAGVADADLGVADAAVGCGDAQRLHCAERIRIERQRVGSG